MKKTEKSVFVENLTKELKAVNTAFLVDYAGLSVANQNELKKRLREVDASFIVIKNTLLNLAGKEAKIPEEVLTDTVLVGQNALVLAAGDPIKPLGVIVKFAGEFTGTAGNPLAQIKVGYLEGFFQDKNALINLAKLGTKEAIISQLIGVLMAPTYNLVGVTSAKLQEFVSIIEQISKQPKTLSPEASEKKNTEAEVSPKAV